MPYREIPVNVGEAGLVRLAARKPCPECDDLRWVWGDPCCLCYATNATELKLRARYENEKRARAALSRLDAASKEGA